MEWFTRDWRGVKSEFEIEEVESSSWRNSDVEESRAKAFTEE